MMADSSSSKHKPTATVPRRAYSISEFCRAYSVSRAKVYRLLAGGDLVAVKLGNKNLIPVEVAERWFASLERWGGR